VNAPSAICETLSRMKLFSSRGPKCCDDTVSATTSTEKVTLTTVIVEPATAERSARAPSAPPP
jgi:hypothetical protein